MTSYWQRAEDRRRQLSCYGEDKPETIESLLLVAEIHLKRSLFREASRLFQEAIDRSGDQAALSLRGLRGLGLSWCKMGRLDAARKVSRGGANASGVDTQRGTKPWYEAIEKLLGRSPRRELLG